MTKEQDEFLNMIVEEILSEGVEDMRIMFFEISKEELIIRYFKEGLDLFKEFKQIIAEQFGISSKDELTVELISRIYDTVKWLN